MFSLFSVVLLTLTAVLGVQGQVFNTEYGPVRGQTIQVHLEDKTVPVTSFYGIPFARAPVGIYRFRPPEKHPGWAGTLPAGTVPAVCMQNPLGLISITHPLWTKYSEDCLSLNIYKPETATGSLPVMVWFHGGAYTGGGHIQYPGHFLAARDTIVVVPNYRLGVFGFASTPDGSVRGNMGMLDQVMALQFVKDNIANFGGDPNRVTIFGQSAGASSVGLHMVSPLSKGLFQQAIMESGAENNIWSINNPSQSPENYIFQVAENLDCPTQNTAEMLSCLRSVSARDLRIADDIACTPGYFCQGFAPIIDGPGGFMPDFPLKLREELKEDSLPIISGLCKDDGSLFTIAFIPESNGGGFTREEFEYYLRTRLVDMFKVSAASEEVYENSYQAFDWYYTPWPYINDLEANRQAFNKMITDAAFGYSWDRNAKMNSKYAPTYTYIQAFRSLNGTSFIPEWMGVPHEGELPYVWGYGYLLINPDVRDDSEIHYDVLGWTPEDITYANYVETLWTNFAKTGNPTPDPVKAPFNNTEITWAPFSETDNFKVHYLDGEISHKENYRQPDYAFFTSYLEYVSKKPVIKKQNGSARKPFQLKSSQFQKIITQRSIEAFKKRFPERADEKLQEFMNRTDL